MNRRRIVLADQYRTVGGGQTVLMSVAKAAIEDGWHTTLWAPLGGPLEHMARQRFGNEIAYVNAPEAKLTNGRKTAFDVLRFLAYSLTLSRCQNPAAGGDLVYVNGSRQVLGMMLLSRQLRRPFIYHVHLDHSRLEKHLLGLVARSPWTAGIIVNSPFVWRRLVEVVPDMANNHRLALVENALDDAFSCLPFEDRFASRQNRLSVAVVGSLNREKGIDSAIQAAMENPLIDLHLIGSVAPGSELFVDELRRMAPPNVTFHGRSANISASLRQVGAHVLLMPSRCAESFGLAVIEGMASSCIGIVSNAGALPDIAARTGALVCEDQRSIRTTLGRLALERNDILTALARQQYESTLSAYSSERFKKQLAAVLSAAATYQP